MGELNLARMRALCLGAFLPVALGLFVAIPAGSQDHSAEINSLLGRMPPDIADYMKRQIGCPHFEGADKERMKDQLEKICGPLEADEAKLRRKYAGHPDEIRALDLVKNGGN
jgi:hypothetical protein